jgi:hypothetical protein
LGAYTYTIILVLVGLPRYLIGNETESAGAAIMLLLALPFGAIFGMIFGAPLAYVGIVFVGIPVWRLLSYYKAESGFGYAIFGGVGGSLLPPIKNNWTIYGEPAAMHNMVAGAVTLLIFWRIASRSPRGVTESDSSYSAKG